MEIEKGMRMGRSRVKISFFLLVLVLLFFIGGCVSIPIPNVIPIPKPFLFG